MYALFMWSRYYPNGGSRDLIDTFSSPEQALEYARENGTSGCYDRYEVMDSSFTTIYSGTCDEL